MLIKKYLTITAFAVSALLSAGNAWASIPEGYYDSCEGKTGQALLEAICAKISNHTVVSYAGLWTLYKTTDVDENGKIWDMYSTKRWTYSSEQCGNYSKIGDCYNREHSFPKSWFNDATPMYSDAFHLYPTDGKVNGQRSNYPFGECANGSYVASSGSVKALGKLGASTFSGYTGTVFEPDDIYKGDFARSYFYMAAAYNNKISTWSSPMLAGNSYPAFSSWAVNLLLKWSRADEVSDKELNRQEAVYAAQKNRNPFIDHPELVEYIWGTKVGQAWHAAETTEPVITQPSYDAVIDMGYAAVGVTRTVEVSVKGKNVTEDGYLFTTGPGLSVEPEELTAAQINAGTSVKIKMLSQNPGDVEGSLNILAGDALRETEIRCIVEDGLPIYNATNVSSDEFTVRWVYLNDAANYTLNVKQGAQSIPGYPKSVTASAESYTVEGVDPNTTYTFYLTSGSLTSAVKSVTTADLIPSIDVYFEGQLEFEAEPGVPSQAAELMLSIENIEGDIDVTVSSPFELSTDKSSWSRNVTLAQDEDRIYLRVNSAVAGEFATTILFSANGYDNDDTEATARVAKAELTTFIETFDIENTDSYTPYKDNTTFTGTATDWILGNAGIGNQSQDKAVNGTKVIRFGNNTTSSLTMAKDKVGGLGTVTFEASKWGSDATPSIYLEYSLDGGSTWQEAGLFNVVGSDAAVSTYTFDINRTGNGRIRFRQSSGRRWFLDNVSISNFTELNAVNEIEYHSWDAYCRGGKLIVEIGEEPQTVSVYGVDGLAWVEAQEYAKGDHAIDLPKGLYIVVSGDFARRVLVK